MPRFRFPIRWLRTVGPGLAFAVMAASGRVQTVSATYLGVQTLATNTTVGGISIGGLSGIAYLPDTDRFRAISDNQGAGVARMFEFSLAYNGSSLTGVTPIAPVLLRNEIGNGLPSIDAEGIAMRDGNAFYVSTEGSAGGDAQVSIPPWIWKFDAGGNKRAELPVPVKFLPVNAAGQQVPPDDAAQTRGVRLNLGFESLGEKTDERTLYVANEAALKQDYSGTYNGTDSQANNSEIRILRLKDLRAGGVAAEEKVYRSDAGTLYFFVRRFNTVADIIPVDDDGDRLLVLERGLTQNNTNFGSYRIRIYQVNFNEAAATNVAGIPALVGASYTRLSKTLIWESSSNMDNVEGMCFGRDVDGFRSLVLVSDNNFSASQVTQFHVFKTNIPAPGRHVLALGVSGCGAASANPVRPTYPAGTEVTLTGTPSANSVFRRWVGDAFDSSNPFVLTMDATKSVPAEFFTLYQVWLSQFFSELEMQQAQETLQGQDPDGDGVTNFFEYALGGHPRASDISILPQGEVVAGEFRLTYRRVVANTDLVYETELSGTLGAESWDVIPDVSLGTTNGIETRRASTPVSGGRKFLRLKVTPSP